MDFLRAHEWIDREFRRIGEGQAVPGLYAPIWYLLERDPGRHHAILSLLSYAPGGKSIQQAVPLAAGMEVFHEFLLMTEDLLRDRNRTAGRPAVHRRWDQNAVILSGDVMLIYAYQLLEEAGITDRENLSRFTTACRMALESCYLLDVEGPSGSVASTENWLDRVGEKRAAFTRVAMALGARLGGMTAPSVEAVAGLGYRLGKALFFHRLLQSPIPPGLAPKELAALASRQKQLALEELNTAPFQADAYVPLRDYVPRLFT